MHVSLKRYMLCKFLSVLRIMAQELFSSAVNECSLQQQQQHICESMYNVFKPVLSGHSLAKDAELSL